jgi:hypothetical protein
MLDRLRRLFHGKQPAPAPIPIPPARPPIVDSREDEARREHREAVQRIQALLAEGDRIPYGYADTVPPDVTLPMGLVDLLPGKGEPQ